MNQKKTFNILMYSHDTYGLGHIRRTMALASHLRGGNTNVLILTGSPIAGRFSFPEQVDFVRIPGMIKKTNEEYLPLSIKINPRHALDIRKNIITTTAKTFQPHLFIVDKEPMGLKKEVLPTLRWMRRCLPGSRAILGLRDIMDDAESVRKTWKKKGIYDVLDTLYDEIWIYGIRDYYDPIEEYAIPRHISHKIRFTGYIPRKAPNEREVVKERERNTIKKGDKLVVVTTGGGGDGYRVMDAYLSMLEARERPPSFRSILVTGPFMPKNKRQEIFKRSGKLGVRAFHFYRQMEKLMASADLVVSMGGYNTLCELLSQKTVTLLIPRETPRREQLIRARRFSRRDLVEYIPWNDLSPETMREKVNHLISHPKPQRKAMSRFRMTGLEVIRERLRVFRKAGKSPGRSSKPFVNERVC
ncbi:MAG: glycosyltransferase [Desulfobacterales bacterium]|nr:glycosyltransferase [Desulfobacterales bacterium]